MPAYQNRVLGLAFEDDPDPVLDQTAASGCEHHELRSSIFWVGPALEIADSFDEICQLTTSLLADPELARDASERAAFVPDEREEGTKARAKAAIAVVLAQAATHPRLQVS